MGAYAVVPEATNLDQTVEFLFSFSNQACDTGDIIGMEGRKTKGVQSCFCGVN